MLSGKKILIGITGSIAAYKAILLVRLLMKKGAEVRIVMTPSATAFVSPLTLSTLAKTEVLSALSDEATWANHVMLGRWADVMIIAPLSCNTLAKMANGHCDNLLLAVYLSATCPVAVAPAMDEDMWHHGATKRNLSLISEYGTHVIPVGNGELASGLFGDGRMAEPEDIILYLEHHFFRGTELAGKRVLITAGPTYEPLDPVRFIGNHSSGKMGFALAAAFYERGAEVLLVSGPTSLQTHNPAIQVIAVKTAQEMYDACMQQFEKMDIAVLAAAVADYSPAAVAPEKIKKTDAHFTLDLVKTRDILKTLGGLKKQHQLLVGFALETNDEAANAQKKLVTKNADFIVLNSLRNKDAGFGVDTNQVTIYGKTGVVYESEVKTKEDIAGDIIHVISKHIL